MPKIMLTTHHYYVEVITHQLQKSALKVTHALLGVAITNTSLANHFGRHSHLLTVMLLLLVVWDT